jgi:hypothetical protein
MDDDAPKAEKLDPVPDPKSRSKSHPLPTNKEKI